MQGDQTKEEMLPLSLLNDYLYCPRRAALKLVEGWRESNEHTVLGDVAHEHADFPGFEHRAGWKLLRALPLFSERLGLSGKADLVEAELRSPSTNLKSQISDFKSGGYAALRPVEYKRGRVSRWDNDRVQLCAQALCLEEMFGITVPEGMIFHAKSQKRTAVVFDAELREFTQHAILQLRAMLRECEISNLRFEIPRLPAAVLKPQCDGCSLREVCLPELSEAALLRVSRALFQI